MNIYAYEQVVLKFRNMSNDFYFLISFITS